MSGFSRRIAGILVLFVIFGLCSCSIAEQQQAPDKEGVKITDLKDRLKIEINGQLFAEYQYQDVIQPHFYPIVGPTGEVIVRRWPVEPGMDGKYEQHDHRGHIGIWFGQPVNEKKLFWCAGKAHDQFLEITSGKDVGVIKCRNKWATKDGEVVCTDTRTYKIYNRTDDRIMDYEITIHASNGDITFEDSKEGSMAIRVATSMAVTLSSQAIAGRFRMVREESEQGGHMVNSEGVRDAECWGKRAAWCDFYGPLKDQTVGVAVFDHPENPRHPTWWFARDYGLLAANPFGAHTFGGEPEGSGDLKIPAGKSQTFKYRFYFHKGDEKEGKVAERYKEYAAAACPKVAKECSKASTKCVK